MFKNIGKKIKLLTQIICWIGIFSSVLACIVLIVADIIEGLYGAGILVGVLCLLFGTLFSWIGSFVLYGFGELIDKVCAIEANTRPAENSLQYPARDR